MSFMKDQMKCSNKERKREKKKFSIKIYQKKKGK